MTTNEEILIRAITNCIESNDRGDGTNVGDLVEALNDVERNYLIEEYHEGAQNRFRNNDYRSFEEWMEDKEE